MQVSFRLRGTFVRKSRRTTRLHQSAFFVLFDIMHACCGFLALREMWGSVPFCQKKEKSVIFLFSLQAFCYVLRHAVVSTHTCLRAVLYACYYLPRGLLRSSLDSIRLSLLYVFLQASNGYVRFFSFRAGAGTVLMRHEHEEHQFPFSYINSFGTPLHSPLPEPLGIFYCYTILMLTCGLNSHPPTKGGGWSPIVL